MSVAVSKTLLFPTLSNVKFSDLRISFKTTSSGEIRASELRRNTSITETNPIVPDATENAAVSVENNLKISQFQNTIKYYDLNQSGADTNLNLNLTLQTWNSNLTKNIQKRININGTCQATNTMTGALSMSGLMYNVFLIVNGSVWGAGGIGGGAVSDATAGGPAMNLASTGNAITITATSTAAVYGGGGGGAAGKEGNPGPAGTCYYYSYTNTGNSCGSCPDCPEGYYSSGCSSNGGCNCGKGGCGSEYYYSTCYTVVYYNSSQPAGGAGGFGGSGRGSTYPPTPLNTLEGTPGLAGSPSSCYPYYTHNTTQGSPGEPGANGGDWGEKGFDSNKSKGGAAGAAVAGSNYIITQNSIMSAFKGPR